VTADFLARLPLLFRPKALQVGARPTRLESLSSPRVLIDPSLPDESFRLLLGSESLEVRAGSRAGAFYARQTLSRLAPLAQRGELPELELEEEPAVGVRAFMVDVSRDRVPTLESLFSLVDTLARFRYNRLQLYTEHTFAYAGHREVWKEASPLTVDEVAALRTHALERHVAIEPNQNCLGHMERWLIHERYRPLALAPGGYTDLYGFRRPPSTLDPDNPGALELVSDLLSQLLSAYEGASRVHVGLDEPFEMGAQHAPAFARHANALVTEVLPEDVSPMMWADFPKAHRGILKDLHPRLVLTDWGYEESHDFASALEALSACGHSVALCGGTSSWLSLLGRYDNMVANLSALARSAAEPGCESAMVADWGDCGHHQPLAVSLLGLGIGGILLYSPETSDWLADPGWSELFGRELFGEGSQSLLQALRTLGNLYRIPPLRIPNLSSLVLNFYFPQFRSGVGPTSGLNQSHLDAARAALAESTRLLEEMPAAPSSELRYLKEEVLVACSLVALLLDDHEARLAGDGSLESIDASTRSKLAGRLRAARAEYEIKWHARSRPGGLGDSLAWFDNLLEAYVKGHADQSWAGPLARRFFSQTTD
jgi:hexosaminidase